MVKILVDTDLLIDLANNDLATKTRLVTESQRAILTISVITQIELVIGCRNKRELEALNKFLLQFQIIQLSENISIAVLNHLLTVTKLNCFWLMVSPAFGG